MRHSVVEHVRAFSFTQHLVVARQASSLRSPYPNKDPHSMDTGCAIDCNISMSYGSASVQSQYQRSVLGRIAFTVAL